MKKTFIFFAISALFLMLLFPVSVKAETIISFAIPNNGWYWGDQTDDCAGNFNQKNVVNQGAFVWSGGHDDAVKRIDDTWTGVKSGSKCCTRNTVPFNASTYTITLITKRLSDNVTMALPVITIQQGTPSTHYAATAKWDKDGVLQTEDVSSSHQFRYADESDRKSRDKEVTLTYSNVVINSAGSYKISIEFPDGDKEKYQMKSLTIIPTCTQRTLTVSADNAEHGDVTGAGSYCDNSEVTVTATPKAGYLFVNWTNSSSEVVSSNASYTFNITSNLSLTANFEACSGQTVTVNVNNGEMGSATGAGSYCAGAQVDLVATANSGYRFVEWEVTSGSATLDDVNSASTHFTMSDPAAAVTVQANFELDPCSSSLTLEVEDSYAASSDYSGVNYPSSMAFVDRDPSGSGYVSSCHGRGYVNYNGGGGDELIIPIDIPVSGTYKVKAYAGVRKDMFINIYATTSTDQGSITYKSTTYYKQTYKKINDDNFGETFVESDYTDPVSLPSGVCLVGLHGSWSHSAWDQITITRTDGTAFCPNTITMQKSGDDGAAAPTSSPANTAMAGVEVTVTADEPSDANHSFSGWTASSPSVTFEDATALSTTFVMPAEDVTITANYGAVVSSALTFAAGEGGGVVSATAGGDPISSGDEVISGTSVTLTAAANSNYVFINWTDDNNSDAVVSTNAAFTFSMPATATSYTANFAQIDNVISQGSETGSDKGNSGGGASIAESHIADFDAFGHNVVKLTYSNMSGSSAYCGWNIGKSGSYNSASSAGATGFGFYYKTEAADDAVAMWFDPNTGNHADQRGMQLEATENVWKYVYIEHAVANGWNHDNIIIYINGDQEEKTTAKASGAIYIADIAATSITSKDDIANYHYTNDRGGAMAVDDYGTLCLPMGGTITGATLYSVAGKETGDINYLVLEEEGNTIVAGKPYITQSTATSYNVTMSGAHSAVQDGNGLEGTYETITLTPYDDTHHYYFLYANAFKKAGTGVTVGAYRAYLNWDAVIAAPAQAPSARRIRMVIEGKEDQTGMETVTAMPKTTKVLIDGQLFIIREGKRYTLTGARAQ